MRTLRRTSLFLMVVLAAVTACVMPTVSFTDPALQATLQALTVEAAIRATQQAAGPSPTAPPASPTPTASHTASPSVTPPPSLTPTATISPTAVIIASPTLAAPTIRVSVPTNCRAGPGLPFEVEGYLLVGEVAPIVGRDPTGNYWQIPNPDVPGDFCWVWNGYSIITGYTGGLPIYTPPPTPTPTATATPSPGFEMSYQGLVWCGTAWWTQIELENTGPATFRSIEFTLRDLTLDTSVSDEADQFVSKPNCSSSASDVSLSPDETSIVSSPALDNDPAGHNLRARVMLCAKTGLEGDCVTKTLNFKP